MFDVDSVLRRMKNVYNPRPPFSTDKINSEDITLTRVAEGNGNYHTEVSIKESSDTYKK